MTDIKIDTDIVGYGSVILDGVDISSCIIGVDVSVRVGNVTQVILTIVGPVLADADAEVKAKIKSLDEIVAEGKEREKTS